MLKVYLNYLYNSVTQRYSRALFRLLERNPKTVLLDAGYWDGQSTLKYARAIGTKNAIGLELVKSAAEKARQKTVKTRIADLNKKMPLKSNGVDVIVANHVIEHLYNPHVFVEQLYRVLKPGGYAIIGTPNLASWHNVWALFIGNQPYSGPTVNLGERRKGNAIAEMRSEKIGNLMREIQNKSAGESALGHIVVLTYDTLIRLLKAKGFSIETTATFGYHPFPPPIANFLAGIDRRHAHYVLVKARKRMS